MKVESDSILEWRINLEEPKKTKYIFNHEEVGEDDNGFDQILHNLRSLKLGSRVVIRYPFQLSTGSESFAQGLPYYGRMDELDKVIAEVNLTVIYEPQPE